MAGVKISNLPAAGAITGTELVAVVQGSVTKQSTVAATQTTVSGGTTGLTPATATAGAVTLAGTLAIANGGTNATATPTAGAVPYGTGTAYAFSAVGSSGQFLKSNGASAPTWATVTGTGTVTSVAATVPAFLSVTGSPITTTGTLAIAYSGTALPVANGGTNATTASLTSFNNITGYTASGATGTTSTNLVFSASPTFTGTLAAAAVTASTTLGVTGVSSLLGGVVVNSATTNFTQKFQSISTTGQSNAAFFKYVANATGPDITIAKSRGATATAYDAVQLGDTLAAINFAGTDGSALITPGSISAVVDGFVGAGSVNMALYFATGSSGGGGTKLAIASGGGVTMAAYGAGTATFSASGFISSVSDETYKIKDGVVADPMSMIMALEPGYYFGKPEANMGPDRQLGFYAQNVRAAIGPEAAPDPEPSKPWGYFDRSVLAVAVEAIKIQKAQIDALTARIVALEAK
jgi:hypothetical protein